MKTIKEYRKYIELQKGIKVLVYFTQYIDSEGCEMLQGETPKYGAWANYPVNENEAENIIIDTIIDVINDLAYTYNRIPMEKVWEDKRTLKHNLDRLVAKGFKPQPFGL